jgi:hypothetical protein
MAGFRVAAGGLKLKVRYFDPWKLDSFAYFRIFCINKGEEMTGTAETSALETTSRALEILKTKGTPYLLYLTSFLTVSYYFVCVNLILNR